MKNRSEIVKNGAGKGKRPIIGYSIKNYDRNYGAINWASKGKKRRKK